MKPTKKSTTSKTATGKSGTTSSAQGPRNATGPASKSPLPLVGAVAPSREVSRLRKCREGSVEGTGGYPDFQAGVLSWAMKPVERVDR